MLPFQLIRQISANADEAQCPVCFEGVGGHKGSSHVEDLRLGCRCAIHYECLILYFRNSLRDRGDMRVEGILCPYKTKCEALKSKIKGSDFIVAASSLASTTLSQNASSTNSSSSVYYMTTDDMDVVVDYGFVEVGDAISNAAAAGGGGSSCAPKRELHPDLLKRLQEVACEPLSHKEVAELRVWIQEKRQGVVAIDPSQMDPYVVGTSKACPTCSFRSSHYHGHQCHHISPVTRGCPNCHVSYCYKCLSTEVQNQKQRGSSNKCNCGFWSNFCSALRDKNDVKENVYFDENGIPRDKRCGCTFCVECKFKEPCSACSGDCSVCRGVVNPGPLSTGDNSKWLEVSLVISPEMGKSGTAAADAMGIDQHKFRLLEACRQGQLADVRANVIFTDRAGVIHRLINSQDREGKTPLILCCENDHVECVRALLDGTPNVAGVNVNLADHCGRTPLFYASGNGFPNCVRALLAASNIDVNAATTAGLAAGSNPLTQACRNNHLSCVNLLLAMPRINVNVVVQDRCPLATCAFFGFVNCARALCDHKQINVNLQNSHGQAPLFWACYYGFSGIVRTLVDRDDIAVELIDKDGCTPLYWAERFGHADCVEMVKAKRPKPKAGDPNFLFDACSEGDLDSLVEYCRPNCKNNLSLINAYDRDGRTPFIVACQRQQIKVVKAFLSGRIFHSTASPTKAIDKNAVISEQISAIEGQLAGLDPKNKENDTLIESLNFKLFSLKESLQENPLLEVNKIAATSATGGSKGSLVDFNKKDKLYGYSPLHYAVYLKNVELVRLLVSSKRLDINAQTKSGDTCMHIASTYNSREEAKILLTDPLINLTLRNEDGQTPIEVAREEVRSVEVRKILEMATLAVPAAGDISQNRDTHGSSLSSLSSSCVPKCAIM